MCLSQNLPLLNAQCITNNDKHWKCFLALLSITSILTAFAFAPEDCALLATLMEEHHQRFIML